jgi:hypothetical protein
MSRLTLKNSMFQRTAAAFVFALSITLTCSGLHAQEQTAVKIKQTITLDPVGNAKVQMTITLPTNLYTSLKTKSPNVAIILRKLGAGRGWAILENVDGNFNDMQNSVDIHYVQRGFARIRHGKTWSVPFALGSGLDLVDLHGTTAIYQETGNSQIGLATAIIRVECPEGSANLKSNAEAKAFTYDFAPTVSPNGSVDATFAVEHKEAVMSCLAKCYSNERFANLWAARSRFDNSGSVVLSDYRVRFRIEGFSAWSEWHQTSKIYPGQTVVDPYYPVFDLDKLNVLTGPRPVMLETEYEYRRPNGEKVTESDSRKLEILGCNQTIFSGLATSEIMNFSDRLEYIAPVLASFTTPSDPVIQELAGRISGRAGGVGAAFTNAEAAKFLRSLYDFMADNGIAYQSPPTYVNGSQFGQHIKYGRDVLRNHAGTCIDLAILWASTCEAVGLHTVLVVIPGHCFPAVYLPEGQLVAIESTVIGKCDFNKAVEIGQKDLQQANQGESIVADILTLRKSGIMSLDLPAISPNFLSESGYRFDIKPPVRENRPQTRTVQTSDDQPKPGRSVSSVVGLWGYTGQLGERNVDMGLSLREDGRMCFVMITKGADGQPVQLKSLGTWRVDGDYLVLTDETGTNQFKYWMVGEKLAIQMPGQNTAVLFHRAQG